MSDFLLGKCRYCGQNVYYQNGETLVKCPACGEELAVAEFLNEQIKIKKIQEERDKALEDLKKTEKEKKEADQRLYQTLSDLGKAETAHARQQELLEELQSGQDEAKTDLNSLLELTEALQDGQNRSIDFLGVLYSRVTEGQSSAEDALNALQSITKVLQSSETDLQKKTDEIASFLKIDGAEKAGLMKELREWLQQTRQEDNSRLDRISEALDELVKANSQKDEQLRELQRSAEETKAAIEGFEKRWRQSELNKVAQLYRQAESYQFERRFDKAEEYYRQVLILGGNDPEICWRIVLCHYCIEFQVDNEGNRIPSILYPDLRDPSEIEARKQLEASYQTKEQRKYYTERLQVIDRVLDKYRKLCKEIQYDVFISVKQKENGKYTPDCDKAYELYRYIRDELGLRVFNSEQTRPPAGEEFEPYILAALLSSKVMIVVGSCREYMEAQWVRNEWSRYLWLQKHEKANGEAKDRRLFCYLVNGMQPAQMPNELLNIQAIVEGVHAKDELKRTLQRVFREPERKSKQSVQQLITKWEAWLTLKEFDRVKKEYEELVQKGEFLENTRIHLISLCADYKVIEINELPKFVSDLPHNSKFVLADRCAITAEDRALVESLKNANIQEKSKKTNHEKVPELLPLFY